MPADQPTPETPVLRADARRNRESLVTAARAVFAERGLGAPLEEVARRAGVSIGTLYNRFGTRADLVDAVYTDRVEETVRSAERAAEADDPWQGLVEHLVFIAQVQASDRGFEDVCVYSFPPGSAIEGAKVRGHTAFVALVENAQHAGALRNDISVADLGLLLWSVVRATEGIRSSAPDAWRRHLGVLLDGLRAQAAHPVSGQPLDQDLVRQAMTFG
jgi:AcrR family transcriptional regulator